MRTIALIAALFLPMFLVAAEPPEGIRPLGADGKSLNLDFETGDLRDWTSEGEAFKGQPIKGDTVFPRRNDNRSQHQGQYWIGGFEKLGDKPTGTLTSVAFKVTHPWASFLVGGGPWPETCVEVIRADTKELIARVSGLEEENLKRVAVDLSKHAGKEIFIRVVDRHTGHWGHINFDDFRFHSEKPNFPQRKATQPLPAPDEYKFAGIPPKKAAEVMTVPEKFTVSLFAGEPDIVQPIAFCIDDRGRLWVVESFVYPRRLPSPGPLLPDDQKAKGDRILIFEDTDGDGVFDKKIVFMEGLNLVSGIELGYGGVWIGAAPYLLFVPIDAGGDKPAGEPKILLDGWHYEDTHETLNTFTWGPDGWLYGCHGVFTHSRVGKPGTPDDKRIPINAGIWRYHPTKHVFEVFAQGTSNPWGLDFNEHGECFIEACVIPHCFHIFQGGRYLRQAGQHFNPYTYADIQTIADHFHYVGANPHGGNNRSDSAGGGHAHCGLMCYLGGTWEKEMKNNLFMGNIHGRRINMDVLKTKGSGYVAGHGPDFLLANDAWARFINLKYGPDGNVYLIDWYDKQACHLTQPEAWDRTNGRIYKITYRGIKGETKLDMQKLNDSEMVLAQLHSNHFYGRHATRILHERFHDSDARKANAQSYARIQRDLGYILKNHPLDFRRLRALWSLNAIGAIDEALILKTLEDSSEHLRGWAIRLADENGLTGNAITEKLLSLAKEEESPVVRRYLASFIQRQPPEQRWKIVRELIGHREDAADQNLPLMYWYAAEPLADVNSKQAMNLASNSEVPYVLQFMARKLASGKPEALAEAVSRLGATDDSAKRKLILQGINEALKARRRVEAPHGWSETFAALMNDADPEIRRQALALAVTFGDQSAFEQLRVVIKDTGASKESRREALESLVLAGDEKLPATLRPLVADVELRGPVLRAMAAFDDPMSADLIVASFATFAAADKREAVATLASRAGYAKKLLDAIGDKKIAAADVSADIIRQLRNLRNETLDKQISTVWGVVRSTPADKAKLMTQYRQMILKAGKAPDLALGRTLYAKTCQNCHILFGGGGKVGPDITGANRGDLNYLLENVLDPSAVIPKEYMATRIDLKNGRVVTGIIKVRVANALTVATATETLTIPVADIEEMAESATSMMPDDQLKPFSDHEVRSLFAYLQSPSQTGFLATADNAKEFFNGKDLTGWDGDAKLWSVENGEIVGKSPGIKKNEFLKSQLVATDFRLTLNVKLVPNKENSGIQFRSEPLANGEMRGPQADVGAGWWGKLYEESARGLLWDKSGEKHVKVDEWNEYVVEAVGSHVKTWINGQLCVDLNDEKLSRRGVFGLQIHSGGAMEVRFKDLKLEVLGEETKN